MNNSESSEELKVCGLCVNCGDRCHCRFPDFGKNVVHCEAYYCGCPNERESHRKSGAFGKPVGFGIDNWI